MRRISPQKMVFLDESGLDRGGNLTLVGAMRLNGWVASSTMFAAMNSQRFIKWADTKLLPKLNEGGVLLRDNLCAHHDHRLPPLCAKAGVEVLYLPPRSHDCNHIESGWALQKQLVRAHAPRTR